MTYTKHSLTQTIIAMILLCGTFAALIGNSTAESPELTVPADGGAGVDGGFPRGGITVVIDAGHGGEDGGTQSASGLYEKTVNLEIAQLLDSLLRSCGIRTVMTRSEDILLYDRNADYHGHKKMLDLAERRRRTEEIENAIFVSIHMNAFPETKYRGLQVFYSPNHPNSQLLADSIQHHVAAQLQPDNHRKTKAATSAIYLLDRLTCPAVLVECGFLSNPEEAALLETAEYRQQLAFLLFYSVMCRISEQSA